MNHNQENELDSYISSKRNFVNLILKNLSEEVNEGINHNRESLDKIIKKIVKNYQVKKNDLINLILENLRLDF